jgi:hypothetical protein
LHDALDLSIPFDQDLNDLDRRCRRRLPKASLKRRTAMASSASGRHDSTAMMSEASESVTPVNVVNSRFGIST